MSAAIGRSLILLVVAAACGSTHLVPLAPQTSRELPDHSVVVLRTGGRVQLAQGRLTADSLLGERAGSTSPPCSARSSRGFSASWMLRASRAWTACSCSTGI